jgi:AcrR family transcriptional regulator
MTETASTSPPRAGVDKREALLAAARRLIARSGLHDTPTSAVAREAGVAAGTLYLYFASKEALINTLYLELLRDQYRAAMAGAEAAGAEGGGEPTEMLWRAWEGLARWHLDHPEASSVLQQCRGSGILTAETREGEQRAQAEGLARLEEAIAQGRLRDLPRGVFHALFTGPILVLAQLRDAGELEITDAVLRATFDGVSRSVLPGPATR